MIRHIFTIIWNERKANGWIVLEYIIVFCILWFCVDYLYFMAKSHREPLGFDIDHVYYINMAQKNTNITEEERNKYEEVTTFMNRVLQYPGVENVCFARQGLPYQGSSSNNGAVFTTDSLNETVRARWVSSGFFDVFNMKLESGRIFNWEDQAEMKNVVISSDRYNHFGKYPGATTDISEIRSITVGENTFQAVGIVNKTRDMFFNPYESGIYYPIDRNNIDIQWNQIAIRVKPETDNNFSERFMKEMKNQLEFDSFNLVSITSAKQMKKKIMDGWGITDRLNSVYAVTAFLVINIFLGLIGTFWYRTQSRRSEIGLRIALGSSKHKIMSMMFLEALLLLFIASFIGVNICLNIGYTEVLQTMDIPVGDRIQAGTGIEQDFINYAITFGFMAIVSLFAVWYPASQSSDVPPAEALREE